MDVDALIAIYRAAFPVLNRYEEIMWFDANGRKLAGYVPATSLPLHPADGGQHVLVVVTTAEGGHADP
jgi:hypothetical protein